jgi:hypothetical protein
MWHWQTPAIPVVAALCAAFLPAPADAAVDVKQAFDAAVTIAAEPAWNARLRFVADPAITPALVAFVEPGRCDVAALKNSGFIRASLAQLEPQDQGPYLEGLMAHELGHCAEHHANAAHGVIKAQAASAGVENTRAAQLQTLRGELLADIYMGLYLVERHPGRAERLMRFHLERRAQSADVDPEHNSARFLRAEQIERRNGESMLQAALRIRDAVTRGQ